MGVGSDVDPSVWVVAGCLFEVSLPGVHRASWRGAEPGPEVVLLSEDRRGDHHHFRFRAGAPGEVALCFVGDAGECVVHVLIAPEHVAGP